MSARHLIISFASILQESTALTPLHTPIAGIRPGFLPVLVGISSSIFNFLIRGGAGLNPHDVFLYRFESNDVKNFIQSKSALL